MRKNVKQQLALRVLSTAALVAMVSSIATAAFADTYDLTKGSVEIVAKDGIQSITQRDDTGAFVKDEKGENIDNRQDDDITLTTKNKDTGETTTTGETATTGEIKTTHNAITIDAEKGNTAKVTLDNVNIDVYGSSKAALTVTGDGNTEIELNGDNTLISGRGHAGLEKADDVSHGSLTIKDDLNNNGSKKEEGQPGDVGSLNVVGKGGGAGIGGRKGSYDDTCQDTSNITITGGCIKAGPVDENLEYYTGKYQDMWGEYNSGAGIGGASSYGDAKNITITGNADVTAAGGYYSAGIGGSEYGNATNITISGNAEVTASGSHSAGAGIGGGEDGMGTDILIKDDAKVTAYAGYGSAGIGGGRYRGGSVKISGSADVTAFGAQGGAGIGSGEDVYGTSNDDVRCNTTVDISDKANVTAVGSHGAAAIGSGNGCTKGKTTVTITGGTVKAIGGEYSASAIGGYNYDGTVQDVTVTINGTTGNTTVNASCQPDQKGAISAGNGAPDIIHYDEKGTSPFGEKNSVIVRMYNNASYTKEGDLAGCNPGTLYQTVHNRKYMEKDPNIDTKKLEDEDLHDWQLVGKVVEPTTEKDGYADYICSIDKCGQTKHVVLPKLTPEPSEPDTPSTPETPDTPDTPNKPDTPDTPDTPSTPDVPSTPEVTPADPAVTPDAVQADAAPADAAVTPDAKPEAAPAAPAAAAALPQTGANWLAVVGSALSGLFLLAAGFVLDRKGRRMN